MRALSADLGPQPLPAKRRDANKSDTRNAMAAVSHMYPRHGSALPSAADKSLGISLNTIKTIQERISMHRAGPKMAKIAKNCAQA